MQTVPIPNKRTTRNAFTQLACDSASKNTNVAFLIGVSHMCINSAVLVKVFSQCKHLEKYAQAACRFTAFCEMCRRGFASDSAFIRRRNCTYSNKTQINSLLRHSIHGHVVSRNVNMSFSSVSEPVGTVWIEVGLRIGTRKFDLNKLHTSKIQHEIPQQ